MDIEDAHSCLQHLLVGKPNFNHLFVKKRGASLALCSGQPPKLNKHARFTQLQGHHWQLSFPHHSGRWEKSPFIGTLPELFQTLLDDFPFFLEP